MINDILKKVAEDNNVPYQVAELVWKSPWGFMLDQMLKIDLTKDYTEEEFNEFCLSFRVRGIGSFKGSWKRYVGMKKKEDYRLKGYVKKCLRLKK